MYLLNNNKSDNNVVITISMYELASGQAISLPKSEIYCSRNVPDSLKQTLSDILGVQAVFGTGKYLGLPSIVGRDLNANFSYIKDRVWQKINSRSSKCLSKAGCEVMIKSFLQFIPSYVMSIFLDKCGVCVGVAFRLMFVFLTRVFNVLQTVLVVHRMMKILVMYFSIALLLSKFGK